MQLLHNLQRLCVGLEFLTRLILVNIPSYLLAVSPEIDRFTAAVGSYLLFQDVGFCWAFLLNATLAIACSPSSFFHTTDKNEESTPSLSFTRLICSFYVLYASIRVVISFANNILSVALESYQDFPQAAKLLHLGGMFTLRLSFLIFFPSLLLEFGLVSADFVCYDNYWSRLVCKHSGLFYITSEYPEIRKVVLYCTCAMVLQVWQVLLHEFPRWDHALKQVSLVERLAFQISALFLVVGVTICCFPYIIPIVHAEAVILFLLLLLTLWLLLFTQVLVSSHGEQWVRKTTVQSLQHLAAYSRISLMIIFGILFFTLIFTSGFLEAQLQLTFFSVIIPMQYVIIYIQANTLIRAGPTAVYIGFPFSFLFALFVTSFSKTGGNGSILLVTLHCFEKTVQFFGENESFYDRDHSYDEYEYVDETASTESRDSQQQQPTQTQPPMQVHTEEVIVEAREGVEESDSVVTLLLSTNIALRRVHSSGSEEFSSSAFVSRPDAAVYLHERGQSHSSLVSLGLPPSVSSHWAVQASRRNVSFFGNLARSLAVTDSFLSSIMRIAAFILATIAFLLCSISIASLAQQSLKLFPQLISYHRLGNSSFHFDHRVANLTLHPTVELLQNKSRGRSLWKHGTANTCAYKPDLQEPYYAACDWNWQGYSLLDFALLSELAYFDEREEGMLLESMLADLLPSEHFIDIKESHTDDRLKNGPLFLEVSTKDVTIIAIRGTDVGRLRDFLENGKLFGEPVVFLMLSAIFPTIRFWSMNTISRVIEWLYELNSFFGLQEEAGYYKPLTERVLELSATGRQVIITGHSLGGGLARIVGALTNVPSVSFSPPGLAMSHRKYSYENEAGVVTRISNKGLHGRSVAVVTDYDFLAQVDHQVGLVQRILCDKDDKAHQNSCHLLEGTVCHLLEHCGDHRHRFASCTHTYDISAALPTMFSFTSGQIALLTPALLFIPVMIALAVIPELI